MRLFERKFRQFMVARANQISNDWTTKTRWMLVESARCPEILQENLINTNYYLSIMYLLKNQNIQIK